MNDVIMTVSIDFTLLFGVFLASENSVSACDTSCEVRQGSVTAKASSSIYALQYKKNIC